MPSCTTINSHSWRTPWTFQVLVVLAASFMLAPGLARAQPTGEGQQLPPSGSLPTWPGIATGDSLEACRKTLAGWDQKVVLQELPLSQPQTMSKALVESGLLKALNRAAFAHALLDSGHGKDVTFLLAEGSAGRLALAFVGGKLEVWLWCAAVKVDPKVGEKENPFTAARLAPIHGFFNDIGRRCKVRPKGNSDSGRLRVVGHCGSQRVYVEYLPEGDEVWLVFSK